MQKSIAKPGRPLKVYRTSWGDQIPGLIRLKDGRWRISGKNQVTFTESDERLAVARFREMKEAERPSNLGELVMHSTWEAAAKDLAERTHDAGGVLAATIKPMGDAEADDPAGWGVVDETLSPKQWAWLRQELIERPTWVAQRVGLEWLGYGKDLRKPTPSAKLSALIQTYTSKPSLSANEASRSKLFWKEFTAAVGVDRIAEVGHDQVVTYEQSVLASGLSPKSIHHRFSKIRTVVAYGLKRGLDIPGCRHALDVLAMLEVKDAHPIDPRPISPKDFWAIHAQAVEANDATFATMMLTALNCCAYGGEIAAMKWSEFDLNGGFYVGRRPKTKISRVAVLWPEVVVGLKKIRPREGVDFIFNSARRSFTTNAVLKLWRKYRVAAKVDENVTFGCIRDASYSLACQSASLDQAKVLAGHAFSGTSDHYIRRNPEFVADACAAIRRAFYAKSRERKLSRLNAS